MQCVTFSENVVYLNNTPIWFKKKKRNKMNGGELKIFGKAFSVCACVF